LFWTHTCSSSSHPTPSEHPTRTHGQASPSSETPNNAGDFSQPAAVGFHAPVGSSIPFDSAFGQQTAQVSAQSRFETQGNLQVAHSRAPIGANVFPEPDRDTSPEQLQLFPINFQTQATIKHSCKIHVAHIANAAALLTPQKIQNHRAALINLRKPIWRKIMRKNLTRENGGNKINGIIEQAQQDLLLQLKALEEH
jgi:hypothetical protein